MNDVTPLEETECAINGKITEYMLLNSPYYNLQLQSTYQEYSARFDRISLGNDDARILDRADFRITKTSDFLRQLRGSTYPHAPRLIEAIRQELLFTAFRQLDVGRFSSHWQTIQEHGSIVVQNGDKVFMCGPLAFSDNVLHITTSYMKIEQDTLVEVPGFIDAQYMSRTSTWVDTETRETLRFSDDNSGDDKNTTTLDQIINSHDPQAVRIRLQDGKIIPGVYACCFAKSRIGLKTLQSVQIYTAFGPLVVSPKNIVPRESEPWQFSEFDTIRNFLYRSEEQEHNVLVLSHSGEWDWKALVQQVCFDHPAVLLDVGDCTIQVGYPTSPRVHIMHYEVERLKETTAEHFYKIHYSGYRSVISLVCSQKHRPEGLHHTSNDKIRCPCEDRLPSWLPSHYDFCHLNMPEVAESDISTHGKKTEGADDLIAADFSVIGEISQNNIDSEEETIRNDDSSAELHLEEFGRV